ncbi:tRNA (guanosine(46)-N7)-methyltransferase TrmB [Thiobacter aerophilum]|uniref:tRNA (guanine-N(7)-)-methyltransferase n=1 Tax=Thiobacter aerophilum TaxID=3121275 RepID=A0ABV0ECH5_9BURK
MSRAQSRALKTLLPVYGLPYRPQWLNLDEVFGRHAPRILEIGFGMGETTAAIACDHPELDFIGVEVHTPGIGSLLKQIHEKALTNVRIIAHDAVEVLAHMIPPQSLDGVHIFFPDPWPKKRHHKRRLIQPAFVALVADRLRPGGYLHIATDWQPYAEQILAVLSAQPHLENTAAGFAPRPSWRPITKFESRGLKLGHGVWDVLFRKRATP